MDELKERNSITLCKRAGKLIVGFDLCKAAMQTGEAKLIILASDVSEKTRKEALFLAQQCGCEAAGTALTMDELWYCIGKRSGVLAVSDAGLARGFLKSDPKRYLIAALG